MPTKVDVITEQGKTLELPLGATIDGYLVKDIEGLDPVNAVIVSSSFANVDGTQYHASRRDERNIVLKLGLEPSHAEGTGRQLRANLYNYFMPKSNIKLRFYEEELGGFVDIMGRVESFNCPLFVQEIEATISVRCFDSDFFDPDIVTFSGTTTSGTNETVIEYPGTIETGFLFNMPVTDAVSGFTFYHRGPDNVTRTLDFTEPLGVGDVLDISTISGAKGGTLTTEADGSNSILYGITPYSFWVNLFPGTNYIRVAVEEPGVEMPYNIYYTTKYGGL